MLLSWSRLNAGWICHGISYCSALRQYIALSLTVPDRRTDLHKLNVQNRSTSVSSIEDTSQPVLLKYSLLSSSRP